MSTDTNIEVVRVGNFVFTHSSVDDVSVIEVSNLDKSWVVRIPSYFSSYAIVNRLMKEKSDGVENADRNLSMFATNYMQVSMIPNGYFHQGIVLLCAAYYHPDLLKVRVLNPSKESKAFKRDAKRLVDAFIAWRKEYDALVESGDDDTRYDEVADSAKQIISDVED